MTTAAIDRLLAVLVVALAVTGLVSLRMGHPGDAWLFLAHGLLAGALAVMTAWKLRRSVPGAVRARRWGRLGLALIVTLATVAALVGGFSWVASGRLLSVGSWTVLTLHAWIGLALVPLVVLHLVPRRWRLLVPRGARQRGRPADRRTVAPQRLSRRQLLAGGAVSLAAVGTFGAAELGDRLLGGERRFTGSRWLPSGGIPPPTTFFGEGTPAIAPAAWRLRVRGRVANPLQLTGAELAGLGQVDLTAVLDCTSGWAMETGWSGTPLAAVVTAAQPQPGARAVIVRSITGWATQLPLAEAEGAILAVGVAGDPLPAANGAPCRLVVPDRRGLDWVKWVADLEVV
jgi:hypothetical protein